MKDSGHIKDDTSTENLEKTGNVILVLLLAGLPGAGKSSVATALELASSIPVQRIEYDGIEESLLEEAGTLNESANASLEERLEAWRKSRKLALDKLKDILVTTTTPSTTDERSSPVIPEGPESRNTSRNDMPGLSPFSPIQRIILMDDNYYLRSMRKQVFITCQQVVGELATPGEKNPTQIAMVSVWLDTPTELCLARNQKRPRQVPDAVIERMSQQMEHPQDSVESVEKTITGSTESISTKRTVVHHWEKVVWRLNGTETVHVNVDKILLLLQQKQWLPKSIIPLPVDPQIELDRLSAERQRTRESLRHQIDQALRRAVKFVATQINSKHARAANVARKQVLANDNVESRHQAMESFYQTLLEKTALADDEQRKLRKVLFESEL